MLEDLKLKRRYDGFLFLAETQLNQPPLHPHRHVELELNVVKRGSVTYVVRGRRYRFAKRSLLWMYPEQEHQLVDRSPDAQYYVAVFKPGMIRAACRGPVYADLKRQDFTDGVLHTPLDPESFEFLCRTMDAMMAGSLDGDVLNREWGFGAGSDFRYEHGDPDALNAGLRHLLLLAWRCQRAGSVTERAVSLHPAVQRALERLREEEVGEFSLGELARRCGASGAYLSRIFASQVGVSLSRYRNSVRLARFWEVYRSPPQKTVTEAMFAAGFGSYAQFYKVFEQAYGQGPRAVLGRRGEKAPGTN